MVSKSEFIKFLDQASKIRGNSKLCEKVNMTVYNVGHMRAIAEFNGYLKQVPEDKWETAPSTSNSVPVILYNLTEKGKQYLKENGEK